MGEGEKHISFQISRSKLIHYGLVGGLVLSLAAVGTLTYFLADTRERLDNVVSINKTVYADKEEVSNKLRNAQTCNELFKSTQQTLVDYGDNMDAAAQLLDATLASIGDEDWYSVRRNYAASQEYYQEAKALYPDIISAFTMIEAGSCEDAEAPEESREG